MSKRSSYKRCTYVNILNTTYFQHHTRKLCNNTLKDKLNGFKMFKKNWRIMLKYFSSFAAVKLAKKSEGNHLFIDQ